MARSRPSSTVAPSLGLYLGRPGTTVPVGGIEAGNNFRLKQGRVNNFNLGWTRWDDYTLNGPVMKMFRFVLRAGTQRILYFTLKDIYLYNDVAKTVSYLTPRYETGTIAVTNGSPNIVGSGTSWNTELKAGDEIAFGATGIVNPGYSTNGGWYVVQTVTDATHITLTANYSGANNGAIAYTARKLFKGGVTDRWSMDSFLNAPGPVDLLIGSNGGVDKLWKWDGVATQVTLLTSIGFRAKVVRAYRNMMLYGNLIKDSGEAYPQNVINSDVGNPENVTTGLAGEAQVLDGDTGIVSIQPLADAVVIYTPRDGVLAQFVGDPLVFIFRTAITDHGPLTLDAVADFGDRHEFISQDTGYVFDGVTLRPWNGHVWREAIRTQDPARVPLLFHLFDYPNGALIWAFPLASDPGAGVSPITSGPQTAYVEHYLEEVGRSPTPFSQRSFPFTSFVYFQRGSTITWDQLTDTWADYNFSWNDQFFLAGFPLILVGSFDGKIFSYGAAQTGDGALLPSFVRFGRRPTGDGKMRALVARIYPFSTFRDASTLNVTANLADFEAGPYTISDTQVFDLSQPEGQYFVAPYRCGRFLAVEFGTGGQAWEIEGYDVEIRPGSYR